MTASVRIGIVSWNTADLLERCLAALPAALDGLAAEIVVVDNASDDDSADRARRAPGVRTIVNAENVGYARAMNQALADTAAPALLALNPDTCPPPGSVRRLVETLERTGAGIVTPRLTNSDGSTQHSVYRFPSIRVALAASVPVPLRSASLGRRYWLEGTADHTTSGPVDWAIGAVHLIDRSALHGEPPYTERWFMYVEDLELCHRLASRGRSTWFAADIGVHHVGNASGAQRWTRGPEHRWWWATYDFVDSTRGEVVLRAHAAVQLLGTVLHVVSESVLSVVVCSGRGRRRRLARSLASVIPLHARVAIVGRRALTDRRTGRRSARSGAQNHESSSS